MSTKRLRLLTVIGVILIAAVIVTGLLMMYAGHDQRIVTLPPAPAASASEGEPTSSDDSLVRLDVTPGNVQDVVRTLRRPDGYTRSLKIENFYTDGSSGTKTAAYEVEVALRDGALALKVTGAGDVKHIIIAGGSMYVWYRYDTDYYKTSTQKAVYSEDAADEYQMILSYEDLLKVAKDDILEAGTTEHDGENCIYVRYKDGLLGYTTVTYISTATGLLAEAAQYDADMRLVYRMTTSNYSETVPDLSAFNLPGGTNAINNA